MKKTHLKILILAFILSHILLLTFNNFSYAKALSDTDDPITNYGYYKCNSSCIFFKTSDTTNMDFDNIYFYIPEGYFVKKINDISNSTIKVSYRDKIGYVRSKDIKLVSFNPIVKNLNNITFDIVDFSGTQIWRIPSTSNSVDIVYKPIQAGTKNITYIASIDGEIPSGSTSSVWYYVEYSPLNDPTSIYEGYIHSEKTSNLTSIPENIEDDIIIEETVNNTSTLFGLSTTTQTILISLISLPMLTIIVILILKSKRKEKLIESTLRTDMQIDNSNEIKHDTKLKSYTDVKNKKFSIKDKFNNFMFEENTQIKPSNTNQFKFSKLDDIDDDDLL